MVIVAGCDVGATVAARLPASHVAELVGYAAAGAGAAGLAVAGLLAWLRHRSILAQTLVTTLAPVGAVALGATVAAREMFITGADLHALAIILAAAGTVGAVEAAMLGGRLSRAGRSLGQVARQLGDGATDQQEPALRAGSELDVLAAELEATSARLAESRLRAAAVEQSRRELVAWVSHDLRTPLAGVKAMVEALEDGVVDDPETVARYHRTVRQEVDQLASLVSDLFELATIQAGSLTAERRPAQFSQLVGDAVAGVTAVAARKGVKVLLREPQLQAAVSVWPPSITRAVRNLLDNAVRHTPAGGQVLVELQTTEGWVSATVLDECGGIPDEILQHVFDAGYRGDPARTPGDGGAGLGLAIARGLVEAHGGTIGALNRSAGCAFTLRLRAAKAELAATELAATELAATELAATELAATGFPEPPSPRRSRPAMTISSRIASGVLKRTARMPSLAAASTFSGRSSTNITSGGASLKRSSAISKISLSGLATPSRPEMTYPSNHRKNS